MKNTLHLLLVCLLCACGEQTQQTDSQLINVKDAMNAVHPIALSEVTSEPTYIPLETTDESLIGNLPDIRVFNDYILVSSQNQNLKLFDRKTGKFLREIGHVGQDPQGYSKQSWGTVDYWVDSEQNLIYVLGWKNDWHVFDVNNQYIKQVAIEDAERYNLYCFRFVMDGETIYGQNKLRHNSESPLLFSYHASQGTFSEIPGLLSEEPLPKEDYIMDGGGVMFGAYVPFGGGELYIDSYTNDRRMMRVVNSSTMWKFEDLIRVKQPFNDTIYTIRKNQLEPSLIFDLGEWHWKFEERHEMSGCEDKIAIDYMLETPEQLYFHFHTGLYQIKTSKTYCGIYKKESGEVKIMAEDKWLDPQYNQEIQIRNVTNDGHFCALISPDKFTEELMEGLKLTEDDNPVVVVF